MLCFGLQVEVEVAAVAKDVAHVNVSRTVPPPPGSLVAAVRPTVTGGGGGGAGGGASPQIVASLLSEGQHEEHMAEHFKQAQQELLVGAPAGKYTTYTLHR